MEPSNSSAIKATLGDSSVIKPSFDFCQHLITIPLCPTFENLNFNTLQVLLRFRSSPNHGTKYLAQKKLQKVRNALISQAFTSPLFAGIAELSTNLGTLLVRSSRPHNDPSKAQSLDAFWISYFSLLAALENLFSKLKISENKKTRKKPLYNTSARVNGKAGGFK
ncbi:hypothetical protein DI09_30p40 [Mitosporidium daphniae]|uniref:Uncharacterized protein n=1 Tax=Mitosporidium daphniae TaxID=1485682 RepID=A0A098VRB2_9MICR|nr:uncharacterized protein DI09_30p40 [Mitosporidium daphniae]KGG51588.1 hypothetical protein DI09_30p40 [Mitosporidium daphniae]|eukprot:XP_013238046.1 uncharacterized protein DI09_30p40 [Mitosporidium daphniae]